MSKPQDRMVSQRPNGSWANKRNDADKASSLHATQREAIDAARQNLKHEGGGELIIQNRQGRIDRKDTIAPGHDSFPPRG